MTDHDRFILTEQLAHLEEAIERVSVEIKARLSPFHEDLRGLDSIPGVGLRTAEVLLAEMGTSLERFPTRRDLLGVKNSRTAPS